MFHAIMVHISESIVLFILESSFVTSRQACPRLSLSRMVTEYEDEKATAMVNKQLSLVSVMMPAGIVSSTHLEQVGLSFLRCLLPSAVLT